jgi:beta-lactamase class A
MIRKAYRTGLALSKKHAKRHWERWGLYGSAGMILGAIIIVQLAYPWQNLPLYETIDGVQVGGKSVSDVTKLLDEKYAKLDVGLYFGNSPKAYRQPHPADIGLKVSSKPQVDSSAYQWWMRLIPTSMWWAHNVTPAAAPSYTRDAKAAGEFVQKQLGESCNMIPANSSLAYKDKKLQVVPAIDGGTCKLADVEMQLNTVKPTLKSHTIRVKMDQHPAKIHDEAATEFAKNLMTKTKDVSIKAGDANVAVPQDTFLSWLDFTAPDSGITTQVNANRAADFFNKQLAAKVAVKPGTSHISTLDFTEISREDGPPGQALDTNATVALLNAWLSGEDTELTAKVMAVAPTPVYSRSYTKTDTGLTALLTQFAQSHGGTFGIGYAELSGDHRHAGYQDTKIFETASTFKLFVAYGTLKRIESGQWHWADQIQGGRDLTKCLDDMIVKSDNACAEALLSKIGYATLTNEIHAIGLSQSSFLKSFVQSTAADETTFNAALQSGQLLSSASTNTLLSAMKRNIYRQGIPAGASGQVADKVGFMNGLLHDAAIVYSPKGTYVLTIMTDGSSWGTIAELTRQIENFRNQ